MSDRSLFSDLGVRKKVKNPGSNTRRPESGWGVFRDLFQRGSSSHEQPGFPLAHQGRAVFQLPQPPWLEPEARSELQALKEVPGYRSRKAQAEPP